MQLTSRSRTRKPAPNRRQRVPPALTRGIERVDAISILDEIPGDLGLVLWRSVRNVLLWAETPPTGRASLFAGDAARTRQQELGVMDADPELQAPLSIFADLLRHPARADMLRLVNACRRVAVWAEWRGALRTSLEFSQAAALVSPDSASLAYAVGRVARRLADYDRAESWYTRAVVQARESREWRSYASALAGMGNLHMQRGNYPAAKRAHLRCLNAAERHHVPDLVGAAYHNLFSAEVEMQAGLEVDTLAARALEAYGSNTTAIQRLAHDVAHHWNLRGQFQGALNVALALEPVVDDPSVRPIIQSLIARAAGGVGDRTKYDAAVSHADELLSNPAVPEELAARTLLGLAHGALNLGDMRAAAGYADEAVSIARKRAEGRVVLEAEAVLEAATRHAAARRMAATAKVPAAPALAADIVRVLTSGKLEMVAA
ncbi:tetratricopeptide repeat protein [Longimicrobium sp.]|uniref:tetratricopeptide repeat protein n=1 Tax=Longimicrobium sp. TaxID=2029185 RepID=UPI002B69395E|nr:tetratricopeptide repeat protein [Longimicrobium sp.]HSU17838.1 tetratricopeptide repeat protein [Longimicrobium sp.]